MLRLSSFGLIPLFCLCGLSNTAFSPDFNAFLTKMFTAPGQMLMERMDFGQKGSFGGKNSSNQTINNQPVLIVHGVTNIATNFDFVRTHLFKNGYSRAEVYATTYGEGWRKMILFYNLECQYVKQIRGMLQAVYHYTAKKVDVLAYSMGSPIARKAILGGHCEKEYIGPKLTHMVDTFVGIAGANFGSSLCVIPFFICSVTNGLNCASEFLIELNSEKSRYEGSHSFAIYSDSDNKVGVTCCGVKCSSLPFSEQEFQLKGYDHDQVMVASLALQLSLIRNQTGSV